MTAEERIIQLERELAEERARNAQLRAGALHEDDILEEGQ